jgi:uncharacterized protein
LCDMPVVSSSTYRAPLIFLSSHLQTAYPHFFRKITVHYTRERILTPDKDFLDLDWVLGGSRKLAILSHGLEGSARSSYVLGMVRALTGCGWDALAWNFRSCGGEANHQPVWYHGGQSDDLRCVFSHALFTKRYNQIALIGFSLGANLTLKFLGEHGDSLRSLINRAVAISAPCCLATAAGAFSRPVNFLYARHFLDKLKRKVIEKHHLLSDEIQKVHPSEIKDFREFDDKFTGPVHGFKNAEEYWETCSAGQYLSKITVPTLIINAKDDPFLGNGCYPFEAARQSSSVYLECPRHGGHLGFINLNHQGRYWSELRTLEFLEKDPGLEAAEEPPAEAIVPDVKAA